MKYENTEIVHYLLENNLITQEKLNELMAIARKKAEIRNAEDQANIDRIYGTYKSQYIPANNTRADPTANKAIAKSTKDSRR